MPGPQLVTERDVLAMPAGSRIVLSAKRIATPAALDAAFRRHIGVVYEEPGEDKPVQTAGDSALLNHTALLNKMRAKDGTYVVVVKNGRMTVTSIGQEGPEPFSQS